MSELGELPPLDLAIFADTQWEPQAVYKHLEWLESHCSTEIRRVSAGDIRKDALDEEHRFASMPLYAGNGGLLRRQCTTEYKIKPIRKEMSLWVERRHRSVKIIQWIGISLDESHRMKDSTVAWVDNWYPLVEAGISRQDCLDWWEAKGYPPLPRSACIGCPYRTDKEWQSLAGSEMTDATQFDEDIRYKRGTEFPLFLHQKRIPLADVKFTDNDDHQVSWGEECEGMCGV
jgi:hypothetical protein